jgi:ankyrin repeat protein
VEPDREQREALTLEAVRLIAGLGIDLNARNTDGRTALDAAEGLRFQSVIDFLVENGAEPGREPEGNE